MSDPWAEFPDAPNPMSESATSLIAEFLTATSYRTWTSSQVYDAYAATPAIEREYLAALNGSRPRLTATTHAPPSMTGRASSSAPSKPPSGSKTSSGRQGSDFVDAPTELVDTT